MSSITAEVKIRYNYLLCVEPYACSTSTMMEVVFRKGDLLEVCDYDEDENGRISNLSIMYKGKRIAIYAKEYKYFIFADPHDIVGILSRLVV